EHFGVPLLVTCATPWRTRSRRLIPQSTAHGSQAATALSTGTATPNLGPIVAFTDVDRLRAAPSCRISDGAVRFGISCLSWDVAGTGRPSGVFFKTCRKEFSMKRRVLFVWVAVVAAGFSLLGHASTTWAAGKPGTITLAVNSGPIVQWDVVEGTTKLLLT